MNTDYKCPYCEKTHYSAKKQRFNNWKAIRAHAKTCTKNSNSYMICEYYGPISLDVLNRYDNTQNFRKDYPNISFNLSSQWQSLRKSGKTEIKTIYKDWDALSIINSIKEFHTINNRIPQSREFIGDTNYPSYTTVIRHFDSWNLAIEASGFIANYDNGFGVRTVALDGILYRSKMEAYFVDKYLYNIHKYEYEKPYGNGWFYDFYLPDKDLHIELTAGIKPERIKEKIIFNETNNRNFLVFYPKDIYNNLTLERTK